MVYHLQNQEDKNNVWRFLELKFYLNIFKHKSAFKKSFLVLLVDFIHFFLMCKCCLIQAAIEFPSGFIKMQNF